jgi:hypothetical protein
MSVAILKSACAAISLPWSHVSDRRRCSGSSTIFDAIASRAVYALRSVGRSTVRVKRVARSTIVVTCDSPPRRG